MTPGSTADGGVPDAMIQPASSTYTCPQVPRTRPMSWSTSSTATPASAMARGGRRSAGSPSESRPAAGLSSSTRRGEPPTPGHADELRWPSESRSGAGRSGRRGRRWPAPRPRPRRRGGRGAHQRGDGRRTPRTARPPGSSRRPSGRRRARATATCGRGRRGLAVRRQAVRAVPPKRTGPGGDEPADRVDEGGLPAPLGPISPTMAPSPTDSATWSRAWTPPKVTPRSTTSNSAPALFPTDPSPTRPHGVPGGPRRRILTLGPAGFLTTPSLVPGTSVTFPEHQRGPGTGSGVGRERRCPDRGSWRRRGRRRRWRGAASSSRLGMRRAGASGEQPVDGEEHDPDGADEGRPSAAPGARVGARGEHVDRRRHRHDVAGEVDRVPHVLRDAPSAAT